MIVREKAFFTNESLCFSIGKVRGLSGQIMLGSWKRGKRKNLITIKKKIKLKKTALNKKRSVHYINWLSNWIDTIITLFVFLYEDRYFPEQVSGVKNKHEVEINSKSLCWNCHKK